MLNCLNFMLCFKGFKVIESHFKVVGYIMRYFILFDLHFMNCFEKTDLIAKCLHFKFDLMILLLLVFGFIKSCYLVFVIDLLKYFIK